MRRSTLPLRSPLLAALGLLCSLAPNAQAARKPAPRPAAAVAPAPPPAPAPPRGYLRFPAVCADRIAFTAEGDLWWVPRSGGVATRLTNAPGTELMAQWSPDGQTLAYTGSSDGNQEAYAIARDGGAPRRLTVHPAQDQVLGFDPDGNVIIRSRRGAAHWEWTGWRIPAAGGPAVQLPLGTVSLLGIHADGDTVAFNRTSLEFRTWKRYLGGTQQQVWAGSLSRHDYKLLTEYPGNSSFPAFWDDRIVFLSDRDGTSNVWSMTKDGRDLRQHTHHEGFDARWLDVQGSSAVYQLGADLWLLDLVSGRTAAVPITLPTDLSQAAPKSVEPGKSIQGFDLSADGQRVAVASRGEIAVVPVKEGRSADITRGSSAAHDRLPVFSPDGSQVAFVSDGGGEQALWLAPSDGSAPARRLTPQATAWLFEPAWSPDGTRIAVGSSDQVLLVADAQTGAVREAGRSPAWEITEYSWSPDGRFLAYTRPEVGESAVVVVWDSKDGSTHDITSSWHRSFSPTWDPAGRYLYLLSNRTFDPLIGQVDFETLVDRMTRPYAVVLAAGQPDPFFPRPEGAGDEAEDEKPAKPKKGAGKSKAGSDLPAVKIDFDGLRDRIAAFPVPAAHLSALRATKDAVLWLETPSRGLLGDDDFGSGEPAPISSLHSFSLEEQEASLVREGVGAYDLGGEGPRLVLWTGDGLAWRDGLGENADEESISLDGWSLIVDPRAEWRSIFDESWRLQREFYWEQGMAGIDWAGVRERYAPLVERLTTRDELNDLLGQVIAELSTGHTYVWSPGDVPKAPDTSVGLLGADLEPDSACDCHRFTRVLAGQPWDERGVSPLTLSHAGVRAGDRLLEVNGRRVLAADDPQTSLIGQAGKLVRLKVSPSGTAKDAREVDVRALDNDRRLRYLDWVQDRRERTTALSGGRIGYVHVPDMGGEGLSEFFSSFFQQLDADALIIDDRYNGGGFVSQLLIARLSRVLVAHDRPRRGAGTTYPFRTFSGPVTVLTNEQAGSDGDIFPAAFQALGLGRVIGTRTWGGVVGIRADKAFVDGGLSTQPEFAWWDAKRGWGLENHGVDPDIVVDNDPGSVVAGKDRQLETAVEVLLADLAENPPHEAVPPPAPDKSKDAFRRAQQPWLARP